MNLSIRNQLPLDAVARFGLSQGSSVRALGRSTEVSLATGPVQGVSIRNQLPGTVTAVTTSAAMASVKIAVERGELTSAITADSAADLALTVGTPVVALIKSTEVSLATG
jgi:molybdate transport system regulatory protein